MNTIFANIFLIGSESYAMETADLLIDPFLVNKNIMLGSHVLHLSLDDLKRVGNKSTLIIIIQG